MAKKTNCTINGKEYYRIYRKVGMKVNKMGIWVDDRKAFYGSCKREAEEQYQEYMRRKKSGVSSDRQVLGELADNYIYHVFVNDPSYADSTKQQYINAYKKHVRTSRLAGLYIDELSSMDIQMLYNEMDCAPAGLRNVHNLLRLFFKYLEREGVSRDLTLNLVLPEKEPSQNGQKGSVSDDCGIVIRNDDELKKIVSGLQGHRLRLLVILGIHTGCRISELLALSYRDISGNVLSVNKQLTKKLQIEPMRTVSQLQVSGRQKTMTAARTIPLNSVVLEEIEIHKQWQRLEMMEKGYRTEYLFTTSTGAFCDRRNVSRSLDRLYKHIGVPSKPFHVYRHTFGTNLCKKGVPIQTASKLLGHKDINMTAKYYVDVDMEEKQKAVETITISGH
ncbi:MAG: site-specific integrase [Firmicutes bacterium]|jgi:integrase|nr:site-specific integrase [Bacillota bacterium]